ncbi:MAG: tetratricopeptide repeat protein [Candidimonas sp.]
MTRHRNREGLEFTAANAQAVEGYDEAVKRYLQFHQDIGGALKAALTQDPQMPMALCLRGYFYMLMGMRPLVDKARQLAEGLQAQREACTAREQRHIDALASWSRDSLRAATRYWEDIACDHPRDILAVKMAHFGYFYLGRSAAIRDGIAQAIDFWSPRDALYSYMLSMMSFGQVEAGDLQQAEAYGRRALELTPQDPWGVHAVAHSLETTERRFEAFDWIEQHEPNWSQANNFRYHIHWHRALIHLERGDLQAALDWYDRTVFAAGSVEYLDVCNEASLLLRLELNGVPLGDRWQAVAQKAGERVNDQAMGCADVHYMMALSSSPLPEHAAQAQTLMDNLVRYSESGTDNAEAYRVAVVPLARALLAFRQGRYAESARDVLNCADQAHAAGGSHDQRDVYEYLAAEALFRADPAAPRTIAYLARRSFVAPYNRHNWQRYLQALIQAGHEPTLNEAQARCRVALDGDLPEIGS